VYSVLGVRHQTLGVKLWFWFTRQKCVCTKKTDTYTWDKEVIIVFAGLQKAGTLFLQHFCTLSAAKPRCRCTLITVLLVSSLRSRGETWHSRNNDVFVLSCERERERDVQANLHWCSEHRLTARRSATASAAACSSLLAQVYDLHWMCIVCRMLRSRCCPDVATFICFQATVAQRPSHCVVHLQLPEQTRWETTARRQPLIYGQCDNYNR